MAFVNVLPLRGGGARAAKHIRAQCMHRRRAMTAVAGGEERMLHAVYRAGDMGRTGDFLRALGMTLLRDRDVPENSYSNAFYGFGTESRGEHFALELTYNYGVSQYNVGNALAAFVVASQDVNAVERSLADAGFSVNVDQFGLQVCDPTGYPFHVVSSSARRDPLIEMLLNVTDIEASSRYLDIALLRGLY